MLALAKELYGPELIKSRVLELNASDERGISIVREKVKDFARMQLSNPSPAYRALYPCPPYKIIILDEADSMTQDAQSALRRTMETYSKITRFCLICNYVTRIIDPLASRCSKFRFKSLDVGNATKRVEEIAEKEGVALEEGAADTLIRCSEGDLRKAITFLQSAARLVGAVAVQGDDEADGERMDVDRERKAVTVKSVEDIAGVVPEATIRALVHAMQPKSRGLVYEAVSTVVTDMVADGWSATQVVTQVRPPKPSLAVGNPRLTDAALPGHHLQRGDARRAQEQDHARLFRGRQATRGWLGRAPHDSRLGVEDLKHSRGRVEEGEVGWCARQDLAGRAGGRQALRRTCYVLYLPTYRYLTSTLPKVGTVAEVSISTNKHSRQERTPTLQATTYMSRLSAGSSLSQSVFHIHPSIHSLPPSLRQRVRRAD